MMMAPSSFEAPPMAPPMESPPMDAPPAPSMDTDDGPKASGGGGGGADDLMAAIRAAKNKKLRKVENGEAGAAEKEKPTPAPKKGGAEPMDMMSALKARVEMRRKAMLGKHTIEKKDESVAMPKPDGDGDGPVTETLPPGSRKPKAPSAMSDVVLAAMIDSHKKKEKDDGEGEWDE